MKYNDSPEWVLNTTDPNYIRYTGVPIPFSNICLNRYVEFRESLHLTYDICLKKEVGDLEYFNDPFLYMKKIKSKLGTE